MSNACLVNTRHEQALVCNNVSVLQNRALAGSMNTLPHQAE